MVPPGHYTLRLAGTPGPATQTVELRVDPRVAADGVTPSDLAAQWTHEVRVRDLLSEANRDVARLRAALDRLGKSTGAGADTLAALRSVEAQLVTPPIRYSKPALQSQIAYLYGMTLDADQRVGRDALDRYAVLRREMSAVHAELDRLLGATPEAATGQD